MTPDQRTLYLTIVLAYCLFGLFQLSMGRLRGSERAMRLWGASNLSCALGSFLLTQRGLAPDWLTLIVSHGVMLFGYGLMWAGLRQFAGQRTWWIAVVVTPLALMALYAGFAPLTQSLPMRVVLVASLIAAFCLVCARDAWIAQRLEPLKMRRVAIAAFLATALFTLLRIASLVFGKNEPQGLIAPDSLQALAVMLTLALVMLWNLSIMLMASERLENRLTGLAHSDALTTVLNRAGFESLAPRMVERCQRDGRDVTVLVMDLDHFKSVNDRFGHEAGDRLLRAFIETVRPSIRATDLAARLGGEEFCALLPGTGLDEARVIAERIRERFEKVRLEHQGQAVSTTVSIGVAEVEWPAESIDSAIGRADRALYEAKNGGRNRVCAAAPQPGALRRPSPAPFSR